MCLGQKRKLIFMTKKGVAKLPQNQRKFLIEGYKLEYFSTKKTDGQIKLN